MSCDHKVICFQLGFGSSQYCSEVKSAFNRDNGQENGSYYNILGLYLPIAPSPKHSLDFRVQWCPSLSVVSLLTRIPSWDWVSADFGKPPKGLAILTWTIILTTFNTAVNPKP